MTGADEHTTPTDPNNTTPSLARLLGTWQAWSGREVFARAEQQARAAGDLEQAARLRSVVAADREVAALEALAAQHELLTLLAGWEWHTVRAAREHGVTWAEIARVTRTEPEQARAAYLEQVDRHEHAAAHYDGLPFDDAQDYRAAAGCWPDELHPDTPAHVVEQIDEAITRDDVDELAALRAAWWNPNHVPPVTIFPASTEAELAVTAQAQAAAERGDFAEARRLHGIDDAALAALLDAQQRETIAVFGPPPTPAELTRIQAAARDLSTAKAAKAAEQERERGDVAETADLADDTPFDDARSDDAGADRVLHTHAAVGGRAHGADDHCAGTLADRLSMPGWVYEKARRTEADLGTGTAPSSRWDDPAEISARIEVLRARLAEPDDTGYDGGGYTREEQLVRWHTDDHTTTTADADGYVCGWVDDDPSDGATARWSL